MPSARCDLVGVYCGTYHSCSARGDCALRILHVQQTLSRRHGGPSTVLPQLAKAQAAAGHDVVVATTNADVPTGVYHEGGWDVIDGSAVKVLYAPVEYHPLKISLGLMKYLRTAIPKFDIVHIHGLYRFPTTIAAFFCRWHKVPYVIRPHGTLDPYASGKSAAGRLRLKRLYSRWFVVPNLNAAAGIHYTAERERERANYLQLRSPSFVIPNGFDSSTYKSTPQRGRLRKLWGVGDAPLVLFLGRIDAIKGLDLLVQAFDIVRRAEPKACLVIAGPDNDGYGREVRRWVSEYRLDQHVHMVGPLHGADVQQALVDADVFALISRTENFGVAPVEAMACGLPIVISDQVGVHPEVSRNGAGLVTTCDATEASNALLTLLRDPERRSAMGSAGREVVRTCYSWPAIVKALDAQYEEIVRKRIGSDIVDSVQDSAENRRLRRSEGAPDRRSPAG